MKAPLLSVIIPIYNVEDYLLDCLVSLSSQTLSDIEFILVNDGSTDSSLKIINNFLGNLNNNNFKVITTENKGVSSSRNLGIKLSKGEYIGFVDPDDWINDDMFNRMIEIAKVSQSDIISCGYTKVYSNKKEIICLPLDNEVLSNEKKIEKSLMIKNLIGLSEEGYQSALNNFKSNYFEGMIWRNIYLKKLIIDNEISFDENLSYKEDELFHLDCCIHSSKISILNESLYFYRVREDSLTTNYKKNLFEIELNIYKLKIQKIIEFCSGKKEQRKYINYINNKFKLDSIGIINNIFKNENSHDKEKKINIKNILSIIHRLDIDYKIYFSLNSIIGFVKSIYIYLIMKNKFKTLYLFSSTINKKLNMK